MTSCRVLSTVGVVFCSAASALTKKGRLAERACAGDHGQDHRARDEQGFRRHAIL